MSEYTPTTEEIRDYIRAADRVTAHMFSADATDAVEAFDRWLAAHDAEGRATELEAYATDIDRDYAKDAARMRVAGARCLDCDLRYEERDEYSCGERGRGHYYDQHDLEALGALIIEPTWDGDQARERAAAIRAGATPANREGANT